MPTQFCKKWELAEDDGQLGGGGQVAKEEVLDHSPAASTCAAFSGLQQAPGTWLLPPWQSDRRLPQREKSVIERRRQ